MSLAVRLVAEDGLVAHVGLLVIFYPLEGGVEAGERNDHLLLCLSGYREAVPREPDPVVDFTVELD